MPFGIFAMSLWETVCLAFLQNLPSSIQVLRFKDVPFLTSATQDGLSPTLSAPWEQEKALFVSFLKAPQCSYLILFQINITGSFRWWFLCKRSSLSFNCSPFAGHDGRLLRYANCVVSVCPHGDIFFPLPLSKSKRTRYSLALNTGGGAKKTPKTKTVTAGSSYEFSLKHRSFQKVVCYP